jgi:hypothetical protein
MRGQGGFQPLPEIDVLDWLTVGGFPVAPLPGRQPFSHTLHDVLAIGANAYPHRAFQGLQAMDDRQQFHAVVGGVRFATGQFLFMPPVTQQRAPTTGAGIAGTSTVGEQKHVFTVCRI